MKFLFTILFFISFSSHAQSVFYLSAYFNKDSDNSKVLNAVISKAKDGDVLVFPNGKYVFNHTITQSNKGLIWKGAYSTNLIFNHPSTGLRIFRDVATSTTRIEDINFLSRFNGASDSQNGIWCSSPVIIKHVIIENFHGVGLKLTADVAHHPAADVSFAYCEEVVIRSCDSSGIYIQGGDSNAGTFIHCDVRDCGGVGFWDSSFLGNNFFGCMTHNNKKGSFRADDLNSRSNFFGCYCEDGQPPVYLDAAACWFGGLPSSGIEVHGVAQVFSYSTVKIIK